MKTNDHVHPTPDASLKPASQRLGMGERVKAAAQANPDWIPELDPLLKRPAFELFVGAAQDLETELIVLSSVAPSANEIISLVPHFTGKIISWAQKRGTAPNEIEQTNKGVFDWLAGQASMWVHRELNWIRPAIVRDCIEEASGLNDADLGNVARRFSREAARVIPEVWSIMVDYGLAQGPPPPIKPMMGKPWATGLASSLGEQFISLSPLRHPVGPNFPVPVKISFGSLVLFPPENRA